MPTYEYECVKCGNRYEHHHVSSDDRDRAPACPSCGAADAKRVMSGFAVGKLQSFGGGRTCCGHKDPGDSGCGSPGSCCS